MMKSGKQATKRATHIGQSVRVARLLAGSCLTAAIFAPPAFAQNVGNTNELVISSSTYRGTASTVSVGQPLPGGGNAVANGSYPNVFQNATVDASFGVAAPVFLNTYSITNNGASVTSLGSLAVPSGVVTSFSSKSELAINLSTDGSSLTFMGYAAPVNALDVSNSNTPNHVDPTNPVQLSYQRVVAQVNANGSSSITPVNTYSGNNGRAAILANNVNGTGQSEYLTVGNAGNGSGTPPTNIVNNTGVQIATPGGSPETTVVGTQQGAPGAAKGFQYGYSVTQNGYAADKSGKDNNFRGETIYNNTLYVTKGSGSNGINSVYQVGTAGTLPTTANAASTAISILPGFSTALASGTTGVQNPFGIWFANATTLYVADEGDGKVADAATSSYAGLEKYSLVGGVWTLDYTLQSGLNLGLQYSVAGYPTNLNPATDGLRNITGRVNADGTVTIFAVTSTVSASGDQGADPNEVVSITDMLSDTTLAQANGESFDTIVGPLYGDVYRGVSFAPIAPTPLPSTWILLISSLIGVGYFVHISKKNMALTA